MREIIQQKLADGIAFTPPEMTVREARVPNVPGKAYAVIGMRRSGKTWFLYQCLKERLTRGAPRETLVYINFEDERLAGMETRHLSLVLEEYFLRFPDFRDRRKVTFFLDEIQVVPGWETFVRRVLDSEKVEIFLSGSSARLLSREIATSMRGRAMETVIFPFSFREFLRHHGVEPPDNPAFVPKRKRSELEGMFQNYLKWGGFPEAQGIADRDRISLIQGYTDTAVFRDVLERHGISNITALRHLVRHLLSTPAGLFSVHKFHNDLRSRGVPVAKDSLHQFLGHLEDAFLVRLISLATTSERRRESNPRKVYPIDPAIAVAFDRSGKANTGHLLETVVLLELERRACETAYVLSPEGFEVDFHTTSPEGRRMLIQVAADLEDEAVRNREMRALSDALPAYRKAQPILLTMTSTDALATKSLAPPSFAVLPVWEWLLL